MKHNFKIEATNGGNSEILDILVKIGCELQVNKDWLLVQIKQGATWLVVDDSFVFTTTDKGYCHREITLEQLRAMAEPPQREYLNRTYNLVVLPEGTVADGLIEVPEGAEHATIGGDNDEYLYFWTGNEYRSKNHNEWIELTSKNHNVNWWVNENKDHRIIWQREQPSLGEAPVMMHNRCITVPIDPVELTLADRQSQYGSFENVAATTQNLYDLTSRGDMTNVQREALHMICSKLARIANGDPNFAESWHDIAGYAKLVEKHLLETDGAKTSKVVYQVIKNGKLEDL